MAVAFSQTPATVSITCVQGDELSIGLGLGRSVSGYTLSAIVYEQTIATTAGKAIPGGTYSVGDTKATFALSVTSASAGTASIALSETQTAALSTSGNYRWYLRWMDTAGYTQTILSGPFTVVVP
jgi:hypothetical protein